VHESYGVGRYAGLQTMDVAGYTGEFLVVVYAEGDKVYVPVQALHLVSRYTGAPMRRSESSLRIFAGSRSARRRRRS
jgi:transcription-repair coupling factor (superfamily II helicase)